MTKIDENRKLDTIDQTRDRERDPGNNSCSRLACHPRVNPMSLLLFLYQWVSHLTNASQLTLIRIRRLTASHLRETQSREEIDEDEISNENAVLCV